MMLSVVIIVKPVSHFYIILEATVNVSQDYVCLSENLVKLDECYVCFHILYWYDKDFY